MKKKIRDNDQSRNAPRVIIGSTKLQNKTKKRKKEEKKVSMSGDTRIFSGICKSQMTIEFLILK